MKVGNGFIRYFPKPYENELLYSVIARYHRHTGISSAKATPEELFGDRKVVAVYDLPSHLSALANTLNRSGFPCCADDLINKNTLFPLYANFIKNNRLQTARANMLSGKGGALHNLLGLMASSVPNLQFFKYCPECNIESIKRYGELYLNRLHQMPFVYFCPIHEKQLICSSISIRQYNRHEFVYPDENLMRIGILDVFNSHESGFLIKVASIVKELIEMDTGINDWRTKYMSILKLQGFIRGSCIVDNSKLLSEFKSYYGESLLSTLKCSVNDNDWLFSIVRKHRKAFHPIRHILMILFLADSLQQFMEHKAVDVSTQRPINYPERSFTAYHASWLSLKEKHPEKSKNELRRLSPKTYAWLYRNDKEWLGMNSPSIRLPQAQNKRVDWHNRDIEIVEKVAIAIKEIESVSKPFLRVSIGRVGKMIGQLTLLEKHIDKLPLTRKVLKEKVEDTYTFQKRKIDCVVCAVTGAFVNESDIYKKATVAKGRCAETDKYISYKVRIYNENMVIIKETI
ncbi:MAG: TnsD family Tn7-like transposition protein [Deferribacterales bacterium]